MQNKTNIKCYAATSASSTLEPYQITRRQPGVNDVQIEIQYCGVCHSDIHIARNEWHGTVYPVVPGHEIVGTVSAVGSSVSQFKVGDTVGVGCFVDSCRKCLNCNDGLEQYCSGIISFTYNAVEQDGVTRTYGGYSQRIVVDQDYVLNIPKNLDLAAVAPLLCAGITTYSPLRTWKVKAGQRVGVVGLGGLGHMAVKLGAAMGAEVTVISSSRSKESDAKRLGAASFLSSQDSSAVAKLTGSFDFILDTVSVPHDLNLLLGLLKRDCTLTLVGVPPGSLGVEAFPIIVGRKRLAGSLIGGIAETQEMLNFCGEHKITADIELIAMTDINAAYERILKSQVRYRAVIDMASL